MRIRNGEDNKDPIGDKNGVLWTHARGIECTSAGEGEENNTDREGCPNWIFSLRLPEIPLPEIQPSRKKESYRNIYLYGSESDKREFKLQIVQADRQGLSHKR